MRYLTYVVVSAACALLQLILLYCLVSVLGMPVHLSVAIAYVAAVSLHFVSIRKIIFKGSTDKMHHEIGRFIAVNIGGLVITLALMAIFVEILHIWYIAAQALSLILVLTYTYNMHKRVTFRV
jgi:putative flippase GtrA